MGNFIDLAEIARTLKSDISQFTVIDNLDDNQSEVITSDCDNPILLNFHLVIICLKGSFSVKTGFNVHKCESNSICILVKDSFCQFLSVDRDSKLAIFPSETNMFHLAASSIPNLMMFQRYFRQTPAFIMTDDEQKDILSIYQSLKSIAERKDYLYQKEIRQAFDVAMFYIFYAHVGNPTDDGRSTSSRQRLIYNQFLNDVTLHYKENRKLDYYASLQCITPKHLSLAVKNESGIPALHWISEFVMIEARDLLSRKNLSVQEVSDMLHFANQSFFGKYFKSHEGLGPLEYQKQANVKSH